ncbi:MAG: alpha/beta fold hydrolase [Desulfuromonadales bacterium]|nr:alpha/beta fold hydrolase [Desulfuromonadales bacterium]
MHLHCERYGEGSPLIILHGLFGSSDNWRTLGRKLGAHFSAFVVDLRNHGASPHSDDFNYQLMAEDLKVFMDEHCLASAYLLGHSMGGKVAMHFALAWPERLEKLVVVDIAPKEYQDRHGKIIQALVSLRLEPFTERREIDNALLEAIPDQIMRQFLLKNLTRDDRGCFRWRMNLKSIALHYGDINKSLDEDACFDKPTLFLKGGNSDYMDTGDLVEINRFFPHARLDIVQGAGHWLHVDAPAEFLSRVCTFLGAP